MTFRSFLSLLTLLAVTTSLALAQYQPGGPSGPSGPPGGPPGRPGGFGGPGGPGGAGGAGGQTAPKPPASRPAPAITVIKTDDSKIVGTLTSADPDQLTVKKPGKDADSVTIPWKEIKSVSGGGGVTRAKLLEKWKIDNAENLCSTCFGNRTVRCETCKGTAHDPASAKDCETCKAELLVDCKTPKCDAGEIPCPKTCLKLSEGQWTTKDGKPARVFRNPDGSSLWWSDAHLGELITKENNLWVNKGKCPTCSGTTKIKDPACDGTSKRPCPTCTKRPDAPPCPASTTTPPTCSNGQADCATCSATGLKPKT